MANRLSEFFAEQEKRRQEDVESLAQRFHAVSEGLTEETEKVRRVVEKSRKGPNANHPPAARAIFDQRLKLHQRTVMVTWQALLRDRPSILDLIYVLFTAQTEDRQKDPTFVRIRRHAADLIAKALDEAGYFTEERKM